jgi:hypothetical protein
MYTLFETIDPTQNPLVVKNRFNSISCFSIYGMLILTSFLVTSIPPPRILYKHYGPKQAH